MPGHPDIEALIRYREGELPPDRGKAIGKHLAACPECRLECQRLAEAWASSVDRAATASADDDSGRLAGLLAGIQGWESAAAQAGRTGECIKHRVSGNVEKYLGTPATARILQPVSGDGVNLLSSVEPVLALFLGSKAASCLVSHIVEAAIVRI